MSLRNNEKAFRRIRGTSCPAGVSCEINNFNSDNSDIQSKNHTSLGKVVNVAHQRRFSLPLVKYNKRNATRPGHLANYSVCAGGVQNIFQCKLKAAINIIQPSTSRQQQNSIYSGVKQQLFAVTSSVPATKDTVNETDSSYDNFNDSNRSQNEFSKGKNPIDGNKAFKSIERLSAFQDEWKESSVEETNYISTFPANQWNREAFGLDIVKVSDHYDNNSVRLLGNNKQETNYNGKCDKDVKRIECHVYGSELSVERLASQYEEEHKKEFTMNKKTPESELSDLLLLNEEMQTMWSEKEAEVREMLERFSAYRMAVEADSKEKEEIFAEEIIKRDALIKELEFSKDTLTEKLSKKEDAIGKLVREVQEIERNRLEQYLEISQLVDGLGENLSESEVKTKCQRLGAQVQSVIEDLKDSKIMEYTTKIELSGQRNSKMNDLEEEDDCLSTKHEQWAAQLLNEEKEQDNERDVVENKQNYVNGELNPPEEEKQLLRNNSDRETRIQDSEAYQDTERELVYFAPHNALQDGLKIEADDDDLANLVKRLEECGDDEQEEEYIERKVIVKLLEEQWNRYQGICKEKDDEIRHLVKKHKEDLRNLQELLEEQERSEVKNQEILAELQAEVDKLRQRNKFLESEIEVMKTEGEDEIVVLREDFKKDLNDQLKRQSMSFLSSEEVSKSQIIELEEKNEELRRANDDLRRQIAEHCSEIKSWVSGILVLSEEEYNEEFHTISDVLAKLQKIIFENQHLIDQLQDRLREETVETDLVEDTLSQSWGGHSWNENSQKELCNNCRQKKWRRVLMGSFDMLDAGTDDKQDEINNFVEKIDVNEGKYRKRQSLKDSLELAEAQNELRARLGEDGWNSLGALGEDSLEGIGSLSESVDGLGRSSEMRSIESLEDYSECVEERTDEENERSENKDNGSEEKVDELGDVRSNVKENGLEKETDVSENELTGSREMSEDNMDGSGNKMNGSDVTELENPGNGLEEDARGNNEEESGWKEMGALGRCEIGEEQRENGKKSRHITVDDGEMGGVEDVKEVARNENVIFNVQTQGGVFAGMEMEDDEAIKEREEAEDDGDRVRVVNLYRSLVDYSPREFPKDKIEDDRNNVNINNSDDENDDNRYENGNVDSDNDINDGNGSDDHEIDNDHIGNDDHQIYDDDDDIDKGDHRIDYEVFDDSDHDNEKDGNNEDELSRHNQCHVIVNQGPIGSYATNEPTIPCVPVFTFEKDINQNIPEEFNVKDEIKNDVARIESQTPRNDQKNDDSILEGTNNVSETNQNSFSESCVPEQDAGKTSIMPRDNITRSLRPFVEELKDNTMCAGLCSHCSDVLLKSVESYEKIIVKLLELKSERVKEEESQITRDLDAAKRDVKLYQQQYEDLEKVCEDYQKTIHEYSENMRSKNTELRKLQLSSHIMKTEVEWLRQALGITRDYYGDRKIDW